jgi:uncharacterized coiled-coil protein SlyX
MANEHLGTYLNDHLAGAAAALELMQHLEQAQVGTPLSSFFAELRAEVTQERQQLEALMARLQIDQSRTRKALGWLGEKMAVLKLQLDDEADGELALFEGLEAVTIGLEGKRALWETLAIVAEDVPELQGLDYTAVIQRAKEQHQRAEVVRRDAAKAAFRATS